MVDDDLSHLLHEDHEGVQRLLDVWYLPAAAAGCRGWRRRQQEWFCRRGCGCELASIGVNAAGDDVAAARKCGIGGKKVHGMMRKERPENCYNRHDRTMYTGSPRGLRVDD